MGAEGAETWKQTWSLRNNGMYLVDSDFDTEQEAETEDIEEVISNHADFDSGQAHETDDMQENFLSRQMRTDSSKTNPNAQPLSKFESTTQCATAVKKLRKKKHKRKQHK